MAPKPWEIAKPLRVRVGQNGSGSCVAQRAQGSEQALLDPADPTRTLLRANRSKGRDAELRGYRGIKCRQAGRAASATRRWPYACPVPVNLHLQEVAFARAPPAVRSRPAG